MPSWAAKTPNPNCKFVSTITTSWSDMLSLASNVTVSYKDAPLGRVAIEFFLQQDAYYSHERILTHSKI
jgi:hypothetical protein